MVMTEMLQRHITEYLVNQNSCELITGTDFSLNLFITYVKSTNVDSSKELVNNYLKTMFILSKNLDHFSPR